MTSAFSEKFPIFRTAVTEVPSPDGWIDIRGTFAEKPNYYNS